jgi:hypothetical protein
VHKAGIVGTRQFLALLKEAYRDKAKVIVIGDAEQAAADADSRRGF